MLLKRIMPLLLILIMISFVSGSCIKELKNVENTKVFERYFKQSLFLYLSNPDHDIMSFNELNQTLKYYVTETNPIDKNALCSITPTEISHDYNGVNITKVIIKAVKRPESNRVPRCDDGTMYGECSENVPAFCYSGKLLAKCAGPDNNLSTTDDNCGCPPNLECNPDSGKCGDACVNDYDCPGTTTSLECDDNALYNVVCDDICNSVCTHESDTANCVWNLVDNCTLSGYYCIEGQTSCKQCITDSDCNYIYPLSSSCMSETDIEINKQACNAGDCQPTMEIKTCSGNTRCIDDCERCYDKTTPMHEVSFMPAPNPYGIINTNMLTIKVNNIKEESIFGDNPYYHFTDIVLYIYNSNDVQGPILPNNPLGSSCIMGCSTQWDIPYGGSPYDFGNNTFVIRLYNESGRYWDLPNPKDSPSQLGYCKGNVTYDIEP